MADLRDLELRHLVALVAVAETGSFTGAAERLAFSQSAVSQQIAGLERVVGAAVFDRPGGPRRPELTPTGQLLLGHARALLARLDDAARELDDLRSGVAGRLSIGSFQSVLVQLLPIIIGRALAEAPKLDVRLHEGAQDELLARLQADELDLVFVVGQIDEERFEQRHVRSDPFVAVLPLTWPEARDAVIPVSALAGRPLLGDSYFDDPCHLLVDNGLRANGVVPTYVFRANDNGAIQAMVRAGMGAAVMPRLAVDVDDPEVRVLDLDPPLTPRDISIACRRGRTLSPVARRFIELATTVGSSGAGRAAPRARERAGA